MEDVAKETAEELRGLANSLEEEYQNTYARDSYIKRLDAFVEKWTRGWRFIPFWSFVAMALSISQVETTMARILTYPEFQRSAHYQGDRPGVSAKYQNQSMKRWLPRFNLQFIPTDLQVICFFEKPRRLLGAGNFNQVEVCNTTSWPPWPLDMVLFGEFFLWNSRIDEAASLSANVLRRFPRFPPRSPGRGACYQCSVVSCSFWEER